MLCPEIGQLPETTRDDEQAEQGKVTLVSRIMRGHSSPNARDVVLEFSILFLLEKISFTQSGRGSVNVQYHHLLKCPTRLRNLLYAEFRNIARAGRFLLTMKLQ